MILNQIDIEGLVCNIYYEHSTSYKKLSILNFLLRNHRIGLSNPAESFPVKIYGKLADKAINEFGNNDIIFVSGQLCRDYSDTFIRCQKYKILKYNNHKCYLETENVVS